MAGAAHVRPDATVGAVCAAALALSLVHLDVGDEEVVQVQGLGLVEQRQVG